MTKPVAAERNEQSNRWMVNVNATSGCRIQEMKEPGHLRHRYLSRNIKRVVVKIGSAVLTSPRGGLDQGHIQLLADSLSRLHQKGYELALVSSGAIVAGTKKIGLSHWPKSIPEKQGAAAAGQSSLMWAYERSFGKSGLKVAQVLLTRDDMENRRRFINARNTLSTLIRWKILPIINENDTVVIDEIKFGDNDCLSALVTNLIHADLLVMLTDIEGLYAADPKVDPEACLITLMEDVDNGFIASLSSTKSPVGTGGMVSKLQAAKTASVYGVPSIIANGKRAGVLEDILDGKEVGTMVLPKEGKINSWKHWIAYSKIPAGALVVDQGARRVIVEGGKSLLPSGVRRVSGDFVAGDSVSFLGENEEEFARGLVNYSSDEIRRIQGEKTSRIEEILGYKYYDEIVHRDDLVLIR